MKSTFNKLYLTFTCVLVLIACGAGDVNQTEKANTTESATNNLNNRVFEKWQALIDEDFKLAYQYTTPAYRELNDYEIFRAKHGTKIKKTKIEIIEEKQLSAKPEIIQLRIALHFHMAVVSAGVDYEGVSYINESWINQDGTWYYLENSYD